MISGYPNNYPNPAYQTPSVQPAAPATPQAVAAVPVAQSGGTMTVSNILTSIWNGLVNAVKSLFSWIGGRVRGHSSNPTTGTPPTSGSSDLTPQQQAIARQYQILPTAANLNAFLAEVQSYQSNGALGPGSTNTTAISDLQKALDKLGYNLPVTGQYDAATGQAVMQFKQASGLHQSYQTADGNWAMNEYADPQTLQAIMAKLQQQASGPSSPAQSAPAPSPAPVAGSPAASAPPLPVPTPVSPAPTPPVPAPASPAPVQPSVNYDAIARQYGLLDNQANVQAFLAEVQSYQNNGALGPGSTNTTAISDLQKALEKLGSNVPVTGQYDAATIQGVMAFKRSNGIHQNYQATDGNWAVNEYADPTTLAAIMQKLQAMVQPPATPAPIPAPAPAPLPAAPAAVSTTVSPAPVQPSVNYDAIAKQYGLLDDQANVQAFVAEIQGYERGNALGPGSQQTAAIHDLQTALSKLGYDIPITGQYDSATSQAVIAFKRANGIHQTYRAADGNLAVNEYADPQTLSSLMQQLARSSASTSSVSLRGA